MFASETSDIHGLQASRSPVVFDLDSAEVAQYVGNALRQSFLIWQKDFLCGCGYNFGPDCTDGGGRQSVGFLSASQSICGRCSKQYDAGAEHLIEGKVAGAHTGVHFP